MNSKLITIGEASSILGVSIDTLRRWDDAGKLIAVRIGESGHRRYIKSDIELIATDLSLLAKNWIYDKNVEEPRKSFYCPNSSVFKARFDKMEKLLQQKDSLEEIFSLISSGAGEIGNNSFDHNLGNWPDVPGIFFGYDLNKKIIVLADRGQGILKTLNRVRPELKDDSDALAVAFTEKVSGRLEKRGNGLKYVRKIVEKGIVDLDFYTGDAHLHLPAHAKDLKIKMTSESFHGCLAIIKF